ncbi:carboxymuconolactone decarboxylase family protein [Pontibacter anaerobius]|uniref:Alkylhydroperoxidase n=1 Tax=Pontibacter anaerobius TaxID=2993940 RepID=A0ABT3RG48_9BACT|nr:hypothetical protein [Pontibacter anaerobius]MCX2740332.1 hypothetical protein [Pontibacter anaerobius]
MATRIRFSEEGATPFAQLLGHNPNILMAWDELENALFKSSGLDAALLEQVRRTLAFGNQCAYCMAKGKPSEVKADKRESYATAFAELFALDHLSISEAHFDLLREALSEAEIASLCAFISFITASQRFAAIMNLQA